jgi:hypothetical protein
MLFNGINQAVIINQSTFSGHFNNEFTIRMWMKHLNDNNNNNGKEHIFCKSDEKCKIKILKFIYQKQKSFFFC